VSDATLTSKGQTTIPKAIREKAGLHPGDKMHFTVLSSGAIMVRVKNRKVRDLQGMLKSRRKVPVSGLSR
jgi:antitoxin PrlF